MTAEIYTEAADNPKQTFDDAFNHMEVDIKICIIFIYIKIKAITVTVISLNTNGKWYMFSFLDILPEIA
jgi:hypothetical protein